MRNLSLSTSFQKSNINWPQQPPAEKVQKIQIDFHDSFKDYFLSKNQNKVILDL